MNEPPHFSRRSALTSYTVFTLALLTVPGQPRFTRTEPSAVLARVYTSLCKRASLRLGAWFVARHWSTLTIAVQNNGISTDMGCAVLFRTSPFAYTPFQTATRRYTRRLQAARRIATWRKRQPRRKALLLALTTAVVARSVPRQLLWTHERVILRSSRGYRVRGRDGSPRPRLT